MLATFPFLGLSAADEQSALQVPFDLDPAVLELLVDDVDENGQRLMRQEFHAIGLEESWKVVVMLL